MNNKILKLENNKEYYTISTLTEDNINYLLLMNVDNEYDIKIVNIREKNKNVDLKLCFNFEYQFKASRHR